MCYLIVAMRATVVEHEVYIASMFSLSRLHYSLIMRDLRDVKQFRFLWLELNVLVLAHIGLMSVHSARLYLQVLELL